MSSHADVSPLILDIMDFMDALADLKRAAKRVAELKTSDGEVRKVEAVFTDGVGRQAGLERTAKGYRIVSDCAGLTAAQQKTQNESIQQVVQRYSYRKAVKELQAQGYSVAEETKLADGSIKLLVRKWVS